MARALEIKVGILVLLCTGLLFVFVWVLGDFGSGSGFVLHIDFDTASDMKTGAPVKVAGVAAGKVSRVEYWGGRRDEEVGRRVVVRITCTLDQAIGETLHENARLFISTQGMLGEKYIEVDPGSFDRPTLASGAKVVGEPPLRLEVLGQRLAKVSAAVSRILEDNEGSLSSLFRHADETMLVARKTVQDADKLIVDNRDTIARVLVRLDQTGGKVDRVVDSVQAGIGDGGAIRRSLGHVEAVTSAVRSDTTPMLRDTRQITGELRRYSTRLNAEPTAQVMLGQSGHKKVIGVIDRTDKTVANAASAVDDVKAVTANARKGKGTVGGVLMDNELFMDVKLMVKDLKRHPWKFIWRE